MFNNNNIIQFTKKYIDDKIVRNKSSSKIILYIYILNDELKDLRTFKDLNSFKTQVEGLESRIRLAYPKHRHNLDK